MYNCRYNANTTSKPTPICVHFPLYGYKTYHLTQ